MVAFRCTVRGCARELRGDRRSLACPAGHRFDIARIGYVNLLQPQDRRSRRPGDAPAALAARGRLLERGLAAHLVAALGEVLDRVAPPDRGLALLDVGCGDGFFLAAMSAGRTVEAHGVDLSVAAIEAAAKRVPGAALAVANADRGLPFAGGGFDVVTSITARLNPAEMRRVVQPGGAVVVAVPGPDDLAELRRDVLGRAPAIDRTARVRAALAAAFVEVEHRRIARLVELDPDAARDALAATYRGGRRAEQARALSLGTGEVTLSYDLLRFRPRSAAPT